MKAKVEAKGIDNIEGQDLAELGMWTDIIKDLVCYDKDKKIIEAMDEAEESEEAMKYIEMYEDYPGRKGYRGQRGDSRGRYMSRRGYETPMMMQDDREYMRDMDRMDGKMYYTSGENSMGGSTSGNSSMNSGQMGYSESRYDRARRCYEEAKSMHKDNSSEGKQMKMKSLEDYMKELSSDVSSMITDMTPEEKSLMRTKLQTLAQKVS